MSFKKEKLGNIAEIISGSTPDTTKKDFWDGEINWVTPKDLSGLESAYLNETPRKITQAGLQSCSSRMLPSGSVLFSSRAPIGHVAINTVPMCSNQGFKSFVPDSKKLFNKYLYYWLKANRPMLENLGNGATFKEVSKAIISNVEIPLPPLDEQKRIATVLDKAEEVRQKRRQSIKKLDELLQSVFLYMFGDPMSNPKGWNLESLSEVCEINSILVDPTREEYQDLLHYGPDRIARNSGELLLAKTAREDNITSAKFLFNESSILYSKIRPNLNKVALAKERALCSADVYPIEVKNEFLSREFLWKILLSDDFLNYAETCSNRSNIPKINREQFFNYKAIIPPIEEQNKFSEIAKKILEHQKVHKVAIEKAETLFNSLQQRAFTGELFGADSLVKEAKAERLF